MNNNKNNKNNNKNIPKEATTSIPFRVLTQNIRGLNSPSKQLQIERFFIDNKIAVMGLAETKLTNMAAKYIYHNTTLFQFLSNTKSSSPLSQGVGLLISNEYAKFIQKSGGYNGRVVYIDLFLKGRMKLRIIQVYLHANFHSEFKTEIENTHRYIMDLVEQGQRSNYRIILVGDFNVSPEKYKSYYNRSGRFNWKYQILHDLVNHNMVDTVDLHQDIDDTTPHNTYFPTQANHNPSRLDLIYISRDLVVDTLNSNVYQGDEITSDHLAVYASFNTNTIFERQAIAQLKQHKIRRCVFSHDNTSDDDWTQFSALTNHNLRDLHTLVINNQGDLDYYWNLIQKGILNAAYDNLPHHYTSDRQQVIPEDIELSKRNIRFINKILHSYLHLKNFRHPNIAVIRRKWPTFKRPVLA